MAAMTWLSAASTGGVAGIVEGQSISILGRRRDHNMLARKLVKKLCRSRVVISALRSSNPLGDPMRRAGVALGFPRAGICDMLTTRVHRPLWAAFTSFAWPPPSLGYRDSLK